MSLSIGNLSSERQNFTLLSLMQDVDPCLVNTFVFDWKDAFNTPLLNSLRKEAGLDSVIENATNPYEQVIAITYFVHRLWRHDGGNDPGTTNPLEIIRRASHGENFRCVEYARVLSACLRSIGIPARYLALKMADVETVPSGAGHVVVEAFVNDKWIMIDPQENFIPEIKGVPLNALEFSEHLTNFGKFGVENGTKDPDPDGYLERYVSWIQPYLHYLDTYTDPTEESDQRIMLVPEGSKIPRKFQITSSLDNFIYTHNPKLFYANPGYLESVDHFSRR